MKWFLVAFQIACGIFVIGLGIWIIRDSGPMRAAEKMPFVICEFLVGLISLAFAVNSWRKL